MVQLTSRQRLTRLFAGQPIDRVPIWLLSPWHPLEYYADIHHNPAYRRLIPAIQAHCDIFDRRRPDLGFCYNADAQLCLSPIREEQRSGTRMQAPGVCLEQYAALVRGRRELHSFVEDPALFDRLLQLPFTPVRPPLAGYRAEAAELGERGLMMMDLGDPLEVLYHLCSAQDFSLWSLTDYDTLLRFLDEMYRRVYGIYRYFLENGVGDVFFIVGAEFAGPPLVSPQKFNELSVRYVKGLVDLIRSYGKFSIVHYHGNLRMVLDGMAQIAPDGLHTVEEPPKGDCTLAQAREALGSRCVLIGNIQYDDLVHDSPDSIREKVRSVLRQTQGTPFILSPTAGPYEEAPTPRTIDNYLALIDAGVAFGGIS